ncbi:acetyl-CoA acetyltransferase [Paraburkholderia sp. RAU6.4a]|uniref:thiolase family protein n=1 Tax=Paraburkholderia sp. RAU6.4a TaxID=2991067 RepID=UPI003D1908B7
MSPGPYRDRGINGALKSIPATDLGAVVVRETLSRAKLDPARVGSVVLGNVVQASNKMNLSARLAG